MAPKLHNVIGQTDPILELLENEELGRKLNEVRKTAPQGEADAGDGARGGAQGRRRQGAQRTPRSRPSAAGTSPTRRRTISRSSG